MSTIERAVPTLESYFSPFRENIVGESACFKSPYGTMDLIYADWIASGRLYRPIEEKILNEIGPMIGNTHSESTETGVLMTHAYHEAHQIIKDHVGADQNDVIITASSGMTGVLAKFQRILGLKVPEKVERHIQMPEEDRPVVFLTHMEHHSNQTPWLESLADVVVLDPDEELLVNPQTLESALQEYRDRKFKYGSFTACSNVTGIMTPYHELAKVMHRNGGYCFIDFAASAPYVEIDMHPEDPEERLDAIFFSPHKFLGGPGSSGVLVFNKELYHNRIPDHPGGGTVTWTNPWGEHHYFEDIEVREDGGTPGFLQAIRSALAIRLKEKMTVEKIRAREEELVELCFRELEQIPEVHILAGNQKHRLGVFSFYVEGVHHNLMVKLLNDRYGIQVRGGCSCAGTYGHYLLDVSQEQSRKITRKIDQGDWSEKPGWVRLSIHPVMTDKEVLHICHAIKDVIAHAGEWSEDYELQTCSNEFSCTLGEPPSPMKAWFTL